MRLEEEQLAPVREAVLADARRYLADVAEHPHLADATYLPAPSAESQEATYRLLLLSVILGMDHAAQRLTLADLDTAYGYEPLPFDEALQFARSRLPLTRQEFDELSDRMRFRAFTVSRLSSLDAVDRARAALQQALAEGTTLQQFATEMRGDELASVTGWSAEKPWYWENVYRTNSQTAYNAGRAIAFGKNQPAYLEYVGIEDSRQSEICRLRSGTIRPYDDPWWKDNWPPLHYQCRSTVRAIYRAEAEARGLSPTELPKGAPDAQGGFGTNPIAAGTYWKPTDGMLKRAEERGLAGDIISVGLQSGLQEAVERWIEAYAQVYRGAGSVRLAPLRQALGAKGATEKRRLQTELAQARRLADDGHQVIMLPGSTLKGVKNPDAVVDGLIMDFKTARSLRAAGDRYSEGVRQGNVYLEVPADLTAVQVWRELRGELMALTEGTGPVPEHVVWVRIGRAVYRWRSTALLA